MTDKPDSDQPATDQPPVAQAPDLKPEGDKPNSAQKSQDAPDLQTAFDTLSEQVRTSQGERDRNMDKLTKDIAALADRMEAKGGTSSPEDVPASTEPATNVDSAEVTPVTLQQIKDIVAEALNPPTGASAVTPSGRTTPPASISAEEASTELLTLQSKPVSQRTEAEQKRADELMQIMEEAD